MTTFLFGFFFLIDPCISLFGSSRIWGMRGAFDSAKNGEDTIETWPGSPGGLYLPCSLETEKSGRLKPGKYPADLSGMELSYSS